jgi:hypothetical protein
MWVATTINLANWGVQSLVENRARVSFNIIWSTITIKEVGTNSIKTSK